MLRNLEKRVAEFFSEFSNKIKNKITNLSEDLKYRIIAGSLFATTLGFAIGCGSGGGGDGNDSSGGSGGGGGNQTSVSQYVYASQGATLALGDYSVSIPAGILKNNVTVEIGKSSFIFSETEDASYISSVYYIDLNNTGLNGNIQITIPFTLPLSKLLENSESLESTDQFVDSMTGVLYDARNNVYSLKDASYNSGNNTTIYYSTSELVDRLENIIATMPNETQTTTLDTNDFAKADFDSTSPVCLLIHGLNGKASDWGDEYEYNLLRFYISEIYDYGKRVWTFEYPSGENISTNVSKLEEKIKSLNPNFKFDIVGYSMGGIIGRDFTRKNPGYVRKLLMIGSPNEGALSTALENVIDLIMKGTIKERLIDISSPGVTDLLAGSSYFAGLNTNTGNVSVDYCTIAGNIDSWWISGEDDDIVAVDSVHIDDGSPTQHEIPLSIISHTKNGTNHWDLIRYNGGCFDWIKDFLKTQPATGKIVFASNRNGDYEIYNINYDGTGLEKLTDNIADDVSPIWSPDKTKIAFASDKASTNNFEIYIMNADGTNVQRLTYDAVGGTAGLLRGNWPGSFSPDGNKIVFDSNVEDDEEVYVIDISTKNNYKLTSNSIDDYLPDWSPLGDKIVFVSEKDGPVEIYTMNTNGTNVQRLTYSAYTWHINQSPNWSPDGTKLVFDSNREGSMHRIYIMNNDGTNIEKIIGYPITSFGCYSPRYSSDGSKIVFEGDNDIYIINIDKTGLTNITNNSADDIDPDW